MPNACLLISLDDQVAIGLETDNARSERKGYFLRAVHGATAIQIGIAIEIDGWRNTC